MPLVQGITDLPDGFQLDTKPRPVRFMRALAFGLAGSIVLIFLVFVYLAISYQSALYVIGGVAFVLVAAGSDVLLWRILQPPVLKADSTSVTYKYSFQSASIPRSDLTLILKGQVVQRGRYTAWVQSYVFAVSAGTVMFAAPAFWFRSEDVDAFAARLGVPVRGDFTERVSGTVKEPR
jgi:hypothetical protein